MYATLPPPGLKNSSTNIQCRCRQNWPIEFFSKIKPRKKKGASKKKERYKGRLIRPKATPRYFFLYFLFWYFVVFVVLSPYTEWKRQIIEIITVILFVPGNKKALFRLENKIFNSLGKCNVFCSSMDCNQRKPFWRSKMAII